MSVRATGPDARDRARLAFGLTETNARSARNGGQGNAARTGDSGWRLEHGSMP
ncbi:MAG: hypothetical protein ABJE94_13890 [Parasphingorhabdus sp.]|uniref:hypothetical protein n=1 Tax=Parasphingorhabdus sp. TaxID=2709688 RepID=UPI003263702D